MDVKQLNKIMKFYHFYTLKALWNGQGKIKMYYGISRVKKRPSGKRSIILVSIKLPSIVLMAASFPAFPPRFRAFLLRFPASLHLFLALPPPFPIFPSFRSVGPLNILTFLSMICSFSQQNVKFSVLENTGSYPLQIKYITIKLTSSVTLLAIIMIQNWTLKNISLTLCHMYTINYMPL